MGRHLDELRTSLRSADLHLKAGSKVMLLVNHDDTLVNGSVGVVRGFTQCAKGTSTCIGTVTKTHKQKWPVVAFGTEHDVRVVVVGEHVWEKVHFELNAATGKFEKKILASFTHVPLMLAWATTVHKSQGLQFDSVHADVSTCWDAGQAYVAVSRATRAGGLTLNKLPTRSQLMNKFRPSEKARNDADVRRRFTDVPNLVARV